MSDFFDENPDVLEGGGGDFVSEAEKISLANDGVPFAVTQVRREPDPFNKGKTNEDTGEPYERHVLHIVIADGEDERKMAFSINKVESRNRMLDTMEKWLEDPSNEPPVVKLEKINRSWVLRPAE